MRMFLLLGALLAASCASTLPKPVKDARDAGLVRVAVEERSGWKSRTDCQFLEYSWFCNTHVASEDGRAIISLTPTAPPKGSALEAAYEKRHHEWPFARRMDEPYVVRIERIFGPPDWEATTSWTEYERDGLMRKTCVFRPLDDRPGLTIVTCGTWPVDEDERYGADFRSIERSAKLSR